LLSTTAAGKLVFGIFVALAEFERDLITERKPKMLPQSFGLFLVGLSRPIRAREAADGAKTKNCGPLASKHVRERDDYDEPVVVRAEERLLPFVWPAQFL
jgi:hypothetical protein